MGHYAGPGNRSLAAASCWSDEVVCPKPRRRRLASPSFNDVVTLRPMRWFTSHHQDCFGSEAAENGLSEIILLQGSGGGADTETDESGQHLMAFGLSGSPPARVANPHIQDPRFFEVKSWKPAVRIEGFDPPPPPGKISSTLP